MEVGERRAHLLEVGTRLFTELPYDEVEVGAIAEAAGVSRGLLYRYFPDKVSFFAEVLVARLADMAERTGPDMSLPPVDRARAALDDYFDLLHDRPQWYVSIYRGSASASPVVREVMAELDAGLVDHLFAFFPDAEDTPLTRLALRGWLSYLSAIGVALIDGAEVDRTALRERCLGVILAIVDAASWPAASGADPTDATGRT